MKVSWNRKDALPLFPPPLSKVVFLSIIGPHYVSLSFVQCCQRSKGDVSNRYTLSVTFSLKKASWLLIYRSIERFYVLHRLVITDTQRTGMGSKKTGFDKFISFCFLTLPPGFSPLHIRLLVLLQDYFLASVTSVKTSDARPHYYYCLIMISGFFHLHSKSKSTTTSEPSWTP